MKVYNYAQIENMQDWFPSMILAVDPGEDDTNGWCLFDPINMKLEECGTFQFDELNKWAFGSGRFVTADLILCEEFVLYPFKAAEQSFSGFPAVEVVGVLRYLSQLHTKVFVTQRAIERVFWGSERQAKKYAAGNERLRKAGFWLENKHARDAVRHVLTYLGARNHPQTLALISRIAQTGNI